MNSKISVILICLGILGGKALDAQQPSVSWGQYEKLQRGNYGKEIVHQDGKYVYLLEKEDRDVNLLLFSVNRPPDLILQVYDAKTFQLVKVNYLSFPQKKEATYVYSFLDLLEINGVKLLFLKAEDSRTKNVKLLAQEISPTGEQKGNIYELDEAQANPSSGLFAKKEVGDFAVIASPDHKNFAVLRVDPFEEGSKKSIKLKIVRENMKVSWSGEVDLPYKEDFYEIKNYSLSNAGEFFLLGKVYKTEERVGLSGKTKTKVIRAAEGSPNYNYSFFVFRTQNNSSQEFDLSLPRQYITDLDFSFDSDSASIRFAGFYSKKWGDAIGGTFTVSINHREEKVNYTYQKDFSPSFLELFLSDRNYERLIEKDRPYEELSNFRLDHYVVKPDGTSFLVAEKYFVVVNTSTIRDQYGYNRTTTSYTYHYDEIIVIYIDAKGNINWSAKVPKKQMTYNDDGPYSSYILNVEDDRIYLLFNDHRDNFDRYQDGKELKNMGNPKRTIATCVTISNNGTMQRKALFDTAEKEIVFRPKSSWYQRDIYHDHRIYLFGINYGYFRTTKFKIGAIDFPTP